MNAPNRTSDFVFRSLATGVLGEDTWQAIADGIGGGRADALNVPVPTGLRFRNLYVGWIFTGSPTQTQVELNIAFNHAGRQLAEWTVGQANGVTQNRGGFGVPFSVQEIALGSLGSNQPALVGGDVPGSIIASDYNLIDGLMRYVRMTPLRTFQEADEIRLSGRIYTNGTITSVFKLFCGVHSSIMNL